MFSEDLKSVSSSLSQLNDALDDWPNSNNNQAGGGGHWPGQPNAPLWPGTPARLQIKHHPQVEGRNEVCFVSTGNPPANPTWSGSSSGGGPVWPNPSGPTAPTGPTWPGPAPAAGPGPTTGHVVSVTG